MTPRRILVTGGQRSGKSRYAESLLADEPRVTYLATGPIAESDADPEWAARVTAHRARRGPQWVTVETADAANALHAAGGPVLLDCLGTWLTAAIDDLGGWDRPPASWRTDLDSRVTALVAAWSESAGPVVAVTNEVGWGPVPAYPSGRLFVDLLGEVNQRMAAVSDEVVLMVAGRPLRL